MVEIRSHKRFSRLSALQPLSRTAPAVREPTALLSATQWQRYLDRLRRLVRRSVHP
jgi:hypothetical protein